MQKIPDLQDDDLVPMTEQALIQELLVTKGEYKKLQDKDNRLIDHVQSYCQNT